MVILHLPIDAPDFYPNKPVRAIALPDQPIQIVLRIFRQLAIKPQQVFVDRVPQIA